jgi:hypothetical protein
MAAQSDCLHVATSPSARHCATIKMRTHLLDCRLRCLDSLTSTHAVAYVRIAFAFTARDF